MKNIVEVIKQKEREIQQLECDIETLRAAARLLAEDSETIPVRVAAAATRPSNAEMKQFP